MEGVNVKLTNQQNDVLTYLRTHNYLTSLNSGTVIGVVDLRKRVSELRRLGYPIGDRTVSKKNRYGRPVRFKQYFLDEEVTDGIQAFKSR